MKTDMRRAALLALISIFLGACSIAMKSNNFKDASTSGTLEIGMTKIEVRGFLGSPVSVSARHTGVDLREVWLYEDRNFDNKVYADDRIKVAAWSYLAVSTLGIAAIFMPPPTTSHYVVFSDGRLLGWDLIDPYAPDLIIETRER